MGTFLITPKKDKVIIKNQKLDTQYQFTICEMQGWRRNMEDATIHISDLGDGNALFGVLDGHGGFEVSKFVSEQFPKKLLINNNYQSGNYVAALQQTCHTVDQIIGSDYGQNQLIKINKKFSQYQQQPAEKISWAAGCTANLVLITSTNYIIANIGDSRSALSRGNESIQLSNDHKPQILSQKKRILSAGGKIINGRVNGGLNLTRCFGDFAYKQNKQLSFQNQLIISQPQIKVVERKPEDNFLLIGCDGIWERFPTDCHDLVELVKEQLDNRNSPQKILTQLFDDFLAPDLSKEIGCDNMTAILILLK